MKSGGIALTILGVLLMGGALIYQPTVETSGLYGLSEETYNLGKLQYQELFFLGGAAAFISGIILIGFGGVLARLEQAGLIKPLPSSPFADRGQDVTYCDWCSRGIKSPNKPCSAVDPEKLREAAPNINNLRCRGELSERGFMSSQS